jgi:hypothetical protein
MPSDTDAKVLSDHKLMPSSFYHKIGLTFLGLTFLVGLVYAGYAYYAGPILLEAELLSQLEAEIAELEANPPPFEFVVVPNALRDITIPEPVIPIMEELMSEFSAAKKNIPRTDGEPAIIFDIPVGETSYIEYINNLPSELQEPIFQMHDELIALTKSLGDKYPQVTLAERVGQTDQLAYSDFSTAIASQPLVYPSLRVVEAEFIATLLATQFPSEAAFYREYADSYITDGVGYGYYTDQEASISAMVVADYIAAAKENEKVAPVLQSLE